MKIYNHDITLYTQDRDISTQLYSGRALGLTTPNDKIQMHEELASEWDAIAHHYSQVGLNHSHDVIWNICFTKINQHPHHDVCVYFFGDLINPHDTYREIFCSRDFRYAQVVEFINSKNNFINLAEELGIPVPQTLRFDHLSALHTFENIVFPCYLKPAVSDHGCGIVRCPDEQSLQAALTHVDPDVPFQIQAEVQAATFLNLQYEVTEVGVQPVLATAQILDGCVHGGNRYPSGHEPWDKFEPFAQWMGDRGMKGIFAIDVAVVPQSGGVSYVAIECNPRFNGSTYPTLIAKRLGIPAWSSANFKSQVRSLKDVDLSDIAFDRRTGKGIVLINWGTIKAGKIGVLLAGSEIEQQALSHELQTRLQG